MLFHINSYCYILTQINSELISTPSRKGNNESTNNSMDVLDLTYSPCVNINISKAPESMEDLKIILKDVFETFQAKPKQLIIEKFCIDMTKEILARLRTGELLNDEIINFYCWMLADYDYKMCNGLPHRQRSYFFHTFFIQRLYIDQGYKYENVKRWTKREYSILKFGKIFIPINIKNRHWTLAIVFVPVKEIKYFDSLKGTKTVATGHKFLEAILKWLEEESQKENIAIGDAFGSSTDWKLIIEEETPQQENGFDCGCFVINIMDLYTRDLKLNFSAS